MWPDRCEECGRFVGTDPNTRRAKAALPTSKELLAAATPALVDHLRQAANRLHARVMRHRERYLRAWIAATGLHPEECELVEVGPLVGPDNVAAVRVYVQRRTVR